MNVFDIIMSVGEPLAMTSFVVIGVAALCKDVQERAMRAKEVADLHDAGRGWPNDFAKPQSPYRDALPSPPISQPLLKLAYLNCPACLTIFADVKGGECVPRNKFLETRFCAERRFSLLRFFGLRKPCAEAEPHLHQHCRKCGARWFAKPGGEARFER